MADPRIKLVINGVEALAARDSYLLGAVEKAGFQVPTLCHHKDLVPGGNCRLCVCEVEVRGRKRLVTACNYPIRGEMTVDTESPAVVKHRRVLAEMYLGRWPNVPCVC